MFRHIKGDVFHFIDVKILSPKMRRERHWRQPGTLFWALW